MKKKLGRYPINVYTFIDVKRSISTSSAFKKFIKSSFAKDKESKDNPISQISKTLKVCEPNCEPTSLCGVCKNSST